jgi:hypothetical protein
MQKQVLRYDSTLIGWMREEGSGGGVVVESVDRVRQTLLRS